MIHAPLSLTNHGRIFRRWAGAFALLLGVASAPADIYHRSGNAGGVTLVRVIVENNVRVPGQAKIFFPHLGQTLETDGRGQIALPQPHAGPEQITVTPLTAGYGPAFGRTFPNGDGIISLRADEVTRDIQAKAEGYAAANKVALAATAFALAAARTTPPAKADENWRKAFELLGRSFNVSPGSVNSSSGPRASPELVRAIGAQTGRAVPASGLLSPADFLAATGLPNFSTIVSDAQDAHFDSLKR